MLTVSRCCWPCQSIPRSPPPARRPRPAQLLRQHLRLHRAGAGQHRDEFLAAIAPEQVLRPQRAAQRVRDHAQAMVAAGVAVEVVDLLEVIDVDEQQRQRRRMPLAVGLEGARDPLVDAAAVEGAGQGVDLGGAPQGLGGDRFVRVQGGQAHELVGDRDLLVTEARAAVAAQQQRTPAVSVDRDRHDHLHAAPGLVLEHLLRRHAHQRLALEPQHARADPVLDAALALDRLDHERIAAVVAVGDRHRHVRRDLGTQVFQQQPECGPLDVRGGEVAQPGLQRTGQFRARRLALHALLGVHARLAVAVALHAVFADAGDQPQRQHTEQRQQRQLVAVAGPGDVGNAARGNSRAQQPGQQPQQQQHQRRPRHRRACAQPLRHHDHAQCAGGQRTGGHVDLQRPGQRLQVQQAGRGARVQRPGERAVRALQPRVDRRRADELPHQAEQ